MSGYTGEPEAHTPDLVACSCCGRRVTQGRTARDQHEDCEPAGIDAARVREAQRNLHRDTAWLLRRLGQAERAAVHDVEAERR